MTILASLEDWFWLLMLTEWLANVSLITFQYPNLYNKTIFKIWSLKGEFTALWLYISKKEFIAVPYALLMKMQVFGFILPQWNLKQCLQVTEIHNFSQDDLMTEDIFVLDCRSEIFVWVGQQIDPKSRTQALTIGEV